MLVEHPDGPAIVQSMDAQNFYALVREAGVDDAWELLPYARSEQLVAFVDYEAWQGDELVLDRVEGWLEHFSQLPDAPFERFWHTLDPEIPALWLRERIAVFLWEDDLDVIESLDTPVCSSPCGVYAIAIPDEETVGPLIRHVLERVYAMDIGEGHRLLEASRWELSSDLQERAYRLRSARLEDAGYLSREDSLEVFAFLEPATWAKKIRRRVVEENPPPITFLYGKHEPVEGLLLHLEEERSKPEQTPFARALGALPDAWPSFALEEVLDGLLTQHRVLAQRVLMADGGAPGDRSALRRASERALRHIDIALDMISPEGDPLLQAKVLATTPLKMLHRIGHAALLTLQRQVRLLENRGQLTLTDAPFSLLETEDRELFAGLCERRPLMSVAPRRPFRRLIDVELAAQRIAAVACQELLLYDLLGATKEQIARCLMAGSEVAAPELVRSRSLWLSAVILKAMGRDAAIAPLPYTDLRQWLLTHPDRDSLADTMDAAGHAFLAPWLTSHPEASSMAYAFHSASVQGFVDACALTPADTPPTLLATTLLLEGLPEGSAFA